MEQAYAIFANVIEFSRDGMPTNANTLNIELRNTSAATAIRHMWSVRRSKVGRSNFSAHRRAKTASLGHQDSSVETVRFGSVADGRERQQSANC